MKKNHLLLLGLTICLFTACHDKLWDAIDDLDVRVARLEELCKEMNTNIVSIQTIVNVVQSGDYITGVTEIKKDGEVIGYTITFANYDPITIYHGQDGKDGADGKDGQDGQNGSASAPVIGVAQDTDGVYYWTLNGEWLLVDNGNKLPVSGKDGQDGANGTMPQLKIEEGYWYISYDNGATWTQLGKATGEDGKDGQNGTDGKDGQDGDSMFQSVTQDESYVYFTLADGTVIKIAKGIYNEDQPNGDEIIDFEDINTLAALLSAGVDSNNDGYISYNEASEVDTLNLERTSIILFREFQHFKNIEYFSFEYCQELRYITLPSNIDNIPEGCFLSCNKLVSIQITEGCKIIGASAFLACNSLRELILPQSLKRIERGAFSGCNSLKKIDIPNSVAYIGTGALKDLVIDTLTLPENYVADPIGILNNPNLKTIVWNSISYPTDYETGLGCYIENVNYPSNSRLENSTIKTIILGEKVESLPNHFCNHMKSITIYSKNKVPPTIDEYLTFYSTSISKIYVPREAVEEYKSKWSKYANGIVEYDFE